MLFEIAVMFVIVVSTLFFALLIIIFLNFNDRKKKFSELDTKSILFQLIIVTIWIALLGNIFIPNTLNDYQLRIAIFGFSVVIGIFLIRNIFARIKSQKVIDKLIDKLGYNNKKLRALDEKKNEFLSIASHQLRGPVSIIKGYTSMILEGDFCSVPDCLNEPLNRVMQSSNSLSFLINDFLNVSKIEKGELEYFFENINITQSLIDILNNFRIIAENHKIVLRKKFDSEKNIKIWADPEKFNQIVSNILDNSIKYTRKGYVELDLIEDQENVKIIIKDTGIGMDEETKLTIFEKFQRSENAKKINIAGSGLGLYVAKVMVEAHGGKIVVESEGENKGSTFTIILPKEVI